MSGTSSVIRLRTDAGKHTLTDRSFRFIT
jgi:hypothetical protein